MKILAVHPLCNVVESLYQTDNNSNELYIWLNLVDTTFTVTGKYNASSKNHIKYMKIHGQKNLNTHKTYKVGSCQRGFAVDQLNNWLR